jgi:hypothetical protein
LGTNRLVVAARHSITTFVINNYRQQKQQQQQQQPHGESASSSSVIDQESHRKYPQRSIQSLSPLTLPSTRAEDDHDKKTTLNDRHQTIDHLIAVDPVVLILTRSYVLSSPSRVLVFTHFTPTCGIEIQ